MEMTVENSPSTEEGDPLRVDSSIEEKGSEAQGKGMDSHPVEESVTERSEESIKMDETCNAAQKEECDKKPKQPIYQHPKVYQDSEGRFVIEQARQDCKEDDCGADQFQKEQPDKTEDVNAEDGTEKKEQALRYLEAFASSVAEEMKKQAAQECFIQENQDMKSHKEDGEDYERQDSTTDDAENPDELEANLETDNQQEHLVTVVITDDGNCKEKPEDEDSADLKKSEGKNTLRRSKRKRRSKKRGYEDEDDEDDDGDDSESVKKAKQDENSVDVKDEDDQDFDLNQFENEEFSTVKATTVNVSTWLCQHCNKIFMTNTQYKQHLRTHSDQKPHQCIFCSKRFRQKCQKDKHERIHTGAKPYHCRHCNRAFSESGSRNRHERIHTGDKPYVCRHCDKSFIQKGNKDAHEKIHTTFKPFKCFNENCNDTFASEEELKKHREGHPQKPYKCHYCCKGFPFNAERKRHERCHTGIKPYKCAFCDKTFTQKGNKDNHERTHTGDKPHCCSYCPKGFIRKQYLEKHMKKKHGKDLSEQQQQQFAQPAVYAVLEIDPNLPKDGHLAAESLLKAAHIVAQHQVALQNGGENSVEAEQLGQVMAEVSQQLSNVEHHVAIVEQDGVQHQVQVVEHHGEINREESVAVLEGQIVEEHEVIGIQNQVVVGEPEVTVSNEGQVLVQQQHQITDEEGHMSVLERRLPAVETRLVSQTMLQPNTQFGGDNQELPTVEGQVNEDHTTVAEHQLPAVGTQLVSHQVLQENQQLGGDNQEFTSVEGQVGEDNTSVVEHRFSTIVSDHILQQNPQFGENSQELSTVEGQVGEGQFINESIIVMRQDELNENETKAGNVSSQEQVGKHVGKSNIGRDSKEMEEGSGVDNAVVQEVGGCGEESDQLNQECKQFVIHGHSIVIQAPQNSL